jgi:hypothetical protein
MARRLGSFHAGRKQGGAEQPRDEKTLDEQALSRTAEAGDGAGFRRQLAAERAPACHGVRRVSDLDGLTGRPRPAAVPTAQAVMERRADLQRAIEARRYHLARLAEADGRIRDDLPFLRQHDPEWLRAFESNNADLRRPDPKGIAASIRARNAATAVR